VVAPGLQQLASAAVAANPAALAVACAAGRLSYEQLDRLASELAAELQRLGVQGRDLVALAVPRSPAMVVGALGILKAGAAYVSLDPSYPAERLQFMLRDCGAHLIVESSADPLVPLVRATESNGATRRAQLPASDGPASYVIYTSGSTGRPKGVVVCEPSLLNLVRWHQEAFAVTPEDRATLMASPGFDASVWELWPYLLAGASVHVPPEEFRRDPAGLRDWLVEHRITIAFVATAIAEHLMTLSWPDDVALRYLLTGGDALLVSPPEGLPFEVINNYGVTEATVVSTSGRVGPATTPGSTLSIGFPIMGAELYVVDEKLAPVGAGESGELLIGGVSVAAGYLNLPELTAERFVPDHLGCEPNARLYRTGDLVRLSHAGYEFLGRVDDQVQVRGYRVETGDVAAALLRHPDVRSCVVVGAGERSAERRLIAYAVPTGSRRPEIDELRAHLAGIVPDFMFPTSLVWLDELPTGPNGKIDRGALPQPGLIERDPPADEAADQPLTDLERTVGNVVAELLGLTSIGLNEDFFLLGGHSLLGAQLIATLSDHVGVEIPLRSLFEGPSVRELALEIERLLLAEIEGLSDEEATQLIKPVSLRSPIDLNNHSSPPLTHAADS
jgi:amino acid adenylation domain-containing protein